MNLASKGDKKTTILDGCCGVGTIILEASYSGFNIEGNDINPKTHQHALLNIKHFNYNAKVSNLDMCELSKKYDSIILDLPYNLYSFSERETIEKIINKASQLAQRLIIVSTHDIKLAIQQAGFIIKDTCKVDKRGNLNFIRTIWVCEKSLQ